MLCSYSIYMIMYYISKDIVFPKVQPFTDAIGKLSLPHAVYPFIR